MKTTNNFNQAIQAYLEDRAKTDELFAVTFSKPEKSISECCTYIIGEAQKQKQGNVATISDAEVFGMAVHYYDEDNIKVAKLPANVKSSVSNTAPTAKQVKKHEPANPSISKNQKTAKSSCMKGVTKSAKLASLRSRNCAICPIRLMCSPEVRRVCHDSFVDGFKKGAKAAEKEIKESKK